MWLAAKLFGTGARSAKPGGETPVPPAPASVIDLEPVREAAEPGGTGASDAAGLAAPTLPTPEPAAAPVAPGSGPAETACDPVEPEPVQSGTAAEPGGTGGTALVPQAPRLKLPLVPLEHHPPEAHARALLAWLQTGDHRGREGQILFDEMLAIYREMLMDLGWAERPWQPVAIEFTKLTTGRKIYAWVTTGRVKQRLRVYPVPGVSDTRLEQLRAAQAALQVAA